MFTLDSVVPWGRNLSEYRRMFLLSDEDMRKRIAGFGDGPASFNAESTEMGCDVTSFDPIYEFPRDRLEGRIDEVRDIVMEQIRSNMDNYDWTSIRDPEELERIRMSAMRRFLDDYDNGKDEGRYIPHELPRRVPFDDGTFDIGLSSHFLLMYTQLGYDFHIDAIDEMLRVCREVRIFPLVDLNSDASGMIDEVIDHYSESYDVSIVDTEYRFQRGGDRLLVIRKSSLP
ncbi:MAG: SAM-dependent methyltransferase [Candidatus Methanomethylophilaceae archaeon]